jgi:hypothetical protein
MKQTGRIVGLLGVLWLAGVVIATAAGSRPWWLLLGWLRTTGPQLLAASLVFASAWGVGQLIRRALLPDLAPEDPLVRGLLGVAFGLAALEAVAVLLGCFGVLSVWPARAVVVAGLLAGAEGLSRGGGLPSRRPDLGSAGWWVVGLGLTLPVLLSIGAPPIGPDEAQYHRRFVEELVRTGGFQGDPQDAMSGFAQGMHALGALAAHLGGVGALRPLSLLMGLGGLLAGQRLTLRVFGAQAAGIYVPIALGAATVLRALPTFNTDLVLGLFVGTAALVVVDWSRSPTTVGGRAAALALLGGGALGIKYTTPLFFGPLYLAVAALLFARGAGTGRGKALTWLCLAALAPALFAVPWLVRNYSFAGHPLFPILRLDPAPDHAAFAYNFTDNYGPGAGLRAALRTPWDLFVLGREYDRRLFLGRLNPWPLAALPGLWLALRKNRQAQVLVGAVALSFVAWAGPLRRVVYLLPVWPLVSAVAAGGLAALVAAFQERLRPVAGAVLCALLVVGAVAEVAGPWSDLLQDAGVACGDEDLQEWEEERLPDARSVRWLRENSKPGETIGFFWSWFAWDLPDRRLVWLGAEEFTPLRIQLDRAATPQGVLEMLRREEVRWIVRRDLLFVHSSYPMLTEEEFQTGFLQPLALVDETLAKYATRRFTRGRYSIYELHAPESHGAD